MRSTHRVTLATALLAAMTPPTIGLTQSATLAGIRFDNPAPHEGALFGFAVAGLHDVNGDGTGDLAVGAPTAGRVYVLSGFDLNILHEIEDPDDLTGTGCEATGTVASPCNFGYALAAVGDVDADGVDDLAVGAPGPFGPV